LEAALAGRGEHEGRGAARVGIARRRDERLLRSRLRGDRRIMREQDRHRGENERRLHVSSEYFTNTAACVPRVPGAMPVPGWASQDAAARRAETAPGRGARVGIALRRAARLRGCTMPDEVFYVEAEGIGTITLNRPQARNALTPRSYAQLEAAV